MSHYISLTDIWGQMVSTSGRLETVPLKQISMWRIPDRTGVAKEDTAKIKNTVRGGLKSSTYETDVIFS